MKPLHQEGRRIIVEGSVSDLPPPELQARLWAQLEQRLDAALPPTAEAASRALGSGARGRFSSSLGVKLLVGTSMVGVLSLAALYGLPADGAKQEQTPRPSGQTVHAEQGSGQAAQAAAAGSGSTAPSTLLQETRLIAAAQRALQSAAPSRALALLDEHRAEFPHGELTQERDGARVLALCALGRAGEARGALQRFTQDWPDSPLTSRLRAGCVSASQQP